MRYGLVLRGFTGQIRDEGVFQIIAEVLKWLFSYELISFGLI